MKRNDVLANRRKDNALLDTVTVCGRVGERFKEFFAGTGNMSERRHECPDVIVGVCWES
jgi:hypothetical protein